MSSLVVITSTLYGDTFGVAREVGDLGAVLEMQYIPPVGTALVVHFQYITPDDLLTELAIRSVVIGHGQVVPQFIRDTKVMCGVTRSVIVRFEGIEDSLELVAAERMH